MAAGNGQHGPGEGAPEPRPGPSSALERRLGGNLPCLVCGYDLKGLSIRSVCPECGTAVRATILAVVDPHAAELEPIRRPKLTALGLVMWVLTALGATIMAWAPAPTGWMFDAWHLVITGMVLASGLGALGLVMPHEGTKPISTILAAIGVTLYAPLAWLVWEVTAIGRTGGYGTIYSPLWFGDQLSHIPTAKRVLVCIIASAAALLLRPNARLLVARSLALRTGRVDRQTILAVVSAAAIAAVGEILLAASAEMRGMTRDIARLAGQIMIPTGWALITVGLIGSLVDAVRISKSILLPPPSLGDVMGKG